MHRGNLLTGLTPQVDRFNGKSEKKISPGLMQEQDRRKTFQAGTGSMSRRNNVITAVAKANEVAEVREFERSAQELSTTIVDLKKNMELFSPQRFAQQQAGTLGRSVSSPLLRRGQGGDGEDNAEEELQERIMKYRFVRKIEPEDQPLPPISSSTGAAPDTKKDETVVDRNRSTEYLMRWRPSQAAMHRTERFWRHQVRMEETRERFFANIEACCQVPSVGGHDFDSDLGSNSQKKLSAQLPSMSNDLLRKWGGVLCVVNFILICQSLVEKYKVAVRKYTRAISKEGPVSGWAKLKNSSMKMKFQKHILLNQFVKAAQENAKSRDGRLGLMNQRLSILGKVAMLPESEKSWQNTIFLQTYLTCRHRIMIRRQLTAQAWECLTAWKRSGTFMVCLKKFTSRIREIQKFWRWAEGNLSETRKRISARWVKLERELLMKKLGNSSKNQNLYQKDGDLPLAERVELAMFDANKRIDYLKAEMRTRRYELLPALLIWQGEMEIYNDNVTQWRANREASKLMGVPNAMVIPIMPPNPTHIPSNEDVKDMINRARGHHPPRSVKDVQVNYGKNIPKGSKPSRASMSSKPRTDSHAIPEILGGPENLTPPPDDPSVLF